MSININAIQGLFKESSTDSVRLLDLQNLSSIISYGKQSDQLEKFNSTELIALRIIEDAIKGRILNSKT